MITIVVAIPAVESSAFLIYSAHPQLYRSGTFLDSSYIVFRRLSSWLRKVVDEIIEFWTAADR